MPTRRRALSTPAQLGREAATPTRRIAGLAAPAPAGQILRRASMQGRTRGEGASEPAAAVSLGELPELQRPWFGAAARDFRLTRGLLTRGLGAIYLVAFSILVEQLAPLLGSEGLTPIPRFLARVARDEPTWTGRLLAVPSLFWLDSSDAALLACAWCGLALSVALTLGVANAPLLGALWLLYGAFVHTGQQFYGYGWEILLLEAGFLGVFLAPAWDIRRWRSEVPPLPVLWLVRWLLFRLMFGAGLIKLRGDSCWTQLTCLQFHYETQPNPHPLSWLLHQAPAWFHAGGALANHFVELLVPFGLFGPRRVRHVAGVLTAGFQLTLIASGNLSFLNWLSLVLCVACFDDSWLSKLLPARVARALAQDQPTPLSRSRRGVVLGLCALVALLSLNPVLNMLSPEQRMNAGFDPLRLVNSYGAFGSVSLVRHEVIIEGALESQATDGTLDWREYEFPCKPGDPARMPCLITPYHYRLDWQLWFAALGRAEQQPWIFNLVYKLLRGDPGVARLLARNPFEARPPKFVRATLYRYEFTRFGEAGWWRRTRVRPYLPELSLDDPRLRGVLARLGWL